MTDRDLIYDIVLWLEAVGRYNAEVREQGEGPMLASTALERIEYLTTHNRLTAHERAWLIRIALAAAQRDA